MPVFAAALLSIFTGATQGESAASFLAMILNAVPGIVRAGKDIATTLSAELSTLKSLIDDRRDPTAAEWQALDTKIADIAGEIEKA